MKEYEELIEALRYCISDVFLIRGCCKCPINKNGMMCGTQDDAIKYAADAIERLQKQNEELQARWSAATIEGFPVKDLMLFAMTCRKNRVAERDLQSFAWNMEKAFEIVRKEFDDSVKNSIDRMMNQYKNIEEFAKMKGEHDDSIRPN